MSYSSPTVLARTFLLPPEITMTCRRPVPLALQIDCKITKRVALANYDNDDRRSGHPLLSPGWQFSSFEKMKIQEDRRSDVGKPFFKFEMLVNHFSKAFESQE